MLTCLAGRQIARVTGYPQWIEIVRDGKWKYEITAPCGIAIASKSWFYGIADVTGVHFNMFRGSDSQR
jgi:hypothetical protein